MLEIPPSKDTDAEDVVWGLQTADTLWKRGERIDALVWLRRAAQAAGDANDDDRALELARHAAELTEWMANSVDAEEDDEEQTREHKTVDLVPSHVPVPLHSPWTAPPPIETASEAPESTTPPPRPPPPRPPSEPMIHTLPPLAEETIDEEELEEIDVEEGSRSSATSVPPAEKVHAGMFDPWAESTRAPVPERPIEPPLPSVSAPEDEEVVTSVRPHALAQPRSDAPPISQSMPVASPVPVTTPAKPQRPTAAPKPPPLPPRARTAKPPLPLAAGVPAPSSPDLPRSPSAEALVASSAAPEPVAVAPAPPAPAPEEPATVPSATEPSPPEPVGAELAAPAPDPEPSPPELLAAEPVAPLPSAPEPSPPEPIAAEPVAQAPGEPVVAEPLLALDGVEAFADLPDDARTDFAASATLHALKEGEEIGTFALAYVVSGSFDVSATMVDAPAVRLASGAVLRSRGTTEEGVPMRLIAVDGAGGVVATWSDSSVEAAFRTCPWVEDDLRVAADRVQTLVGITIGPLGERLDISIREQIIGRLTMRPLGPSEVVVEIGQAVPGLLLVGVGELELVNNEKVSGVVGSGEFLFPTEVLGAGAAPSTARAGPGGALVMFGDRQLAQELLVTCPPLLEVFAGM
jgi:hypothetical protein